MPETQRIFDGEARLKYADTPNAALEGADALVIVTEWKEFRSPDFDRIKSTLNPRPSSMAATCTTPFGGRSRPGLRRDWPRTQRGKVMVKRPPPSGGASHHIAAMAASDGLTKLRPSPTPPACSACPGMR